MSYLEEIHSITSIVGGSPADLGRFPFQAAILENGFQFCGGSLISPNVVLTAAHCAEVTATHVALGCVNINNLNNCEVVAVASRSVFPNFDIDGFLSGDFQLLVLQEDSVQTPVTIAAPGFDLGAGQDLTVIGWGAIDPASQESSGGILLETNVEALSQDSCNDQYRDVFGINLAYYYDSPRQFPGTIVNDYKFCASADGTDSCQGDSGGPIFLRCDATGKDLQVGVVSFGLGCAYDGIPGIYASVFQPEAFEFIENVVEAEGHSLQTIGSTSDFCVVGGTQPSEKLSDPPTPFPTFDLNGWTCRSTFFAANDGCDCNCGIPDPDCEFDIEVFNCFPEDICVNGVCTDPLLTQAPTREPTSPTLPVPTESPSLAPSRSPIIPGDDSFFGELSTAAIVIGVGLLAVVVLLFVVGMFFWTKSASKNHDISSEEAEKKS